MSNIACEVIAASANRMTESAKNNIAPNAVNTSFKNEICPSNLNPVFVVRYTATQFLRASSYEHGIRDLREEGESELEDAATVVRMSPEEFLRKTPDSLDLVSPLGLDDLSNLDLRERESFTSEEEYRKEERLESPVIALTAEQFLQISPTSLGLGVDSTKYGTTPGGTFCAQSPTVEDAMFSKFQKITITTEN
eukprot:Plantae.Rhodophyta-Hildenbrandia_rubra.ctg5604.p2 GENE.Plantae.Rhodophyta-Hildenbrandia_rubra.ctg5604~~Plantae.Rhodophyta-Hildenbrandia_rubra.ctg5604.p2  ORF type:complete len:194 (+),score=23.28 Plantae.Rhodophyta-Hildenbrandia_rubra.ctg5604:325-906(+)